MHSFGDVFIMLAWTSCQTNSRVSGDLRRHNAHVMSLTSSISCVHVVVLYLPVLLMMVSHDDVINWKHFPRFWPLVRGIHRSPVNSSHKDQWREALMFSLICAWINGWVNNGEAGDLRRHRAHYDVIVNNASGLPHSCTQWGSHMYHPSFLL